jgi:hypothetical protein
MSETSSKKRKLSLPLIVAGGVSSLVLALGMSPTFSAFTAQITNSVNTASGGTLVMWEVDGSTICKSSDTTVSLLNSATCSTINKYGSTNLVPGGAGVSKPITISNKGSVAANTFTMNPGSCTQSAIGVPASGASLLACTKMNVKITQGTLNTLVYNGPASDMAASYNVGPLAANTDTTFTFLVTLDVSADNTFQGLQISQPITWNFQA